VIQTKLQNVMKKLSRNDFQKYFQSWKSCWNPYVIVKENCFEEDGVNSNSGKWLSYGRGILGTFG
jgi:hypothetical protein